MNRTARFSDKLFVRSQRWFNLAGFCGAIALSVLACWFTTRQLSANADEPAALPPIKLLFLGDNQPRQHVPRIRYNIIKPVLEQRNITIDYTADMADINPEKLAKYDGLVVYANIDTISPEAAKGAARLRRRRQRLHSAALRVVLLSQFAEVRRAGRRPVSAPRHRHVSHRAGRTPIIR